MVEKDNGRMYVSICKIADCKVVDISVDMKDDASMPISIKIRRDKDATSDLYLSLSLDLADQLQAKLSATLQDLRTREDDKAVALADEINKHKEIPENVED